MIPKQIIGYIDATDADPVNEELKPEPSSSPTEMVEGVVETEAPDPDPRTPFSFMTLAPHVYLTALIALQDPAVLFLSRGIRREAVSRKETGETTTAGGTTLTVHSGRVFTSGVNLNGRAGAGVRAVDLVYPAWIRLPPATRVWSGTGCWFVGTPRGVYAWGDDRFGQLGTDSPAPYAIKPARVRLTQPVLDVASFDEVTFFQTTEGWLGVGSNTFQPLGLIPGVATYRVRPIAVHTPVPIPGSLDVHRMFSNNGSTVAWDDMQVAVAGQNMEGQLGLSDTPVEAALQPLTDCRLADVTDVVGDEQDTLIFTTGAGLLVSGWNKADGSTTPDARAHLTALQWDGAAPVKVIARNNTALVARVTGDGVWGVAFVEHLRHRRQPDRDRDGVITPPLAQTLLGLDAGLTRPASPRPTPPTPAPRPTPPRPVTLPDGTTRVVLGDRALFARTLKGWFAVGDNDEGRLGVGSKARVVDFWSPVRVNGITSIEAVSLTFRPHPFRHRRRYLPGYVFITEYGPCVAGIRDYMGKAFGVTDYHALYGVPLVMVSADASLATVELPAIDLG